MHDNASEIFRLGIPKTQTMIFFEKSAGHSSHWPASNPTWNIAWRI
jgi:hypothetical protein